jgi:hypothetical protein
MTAEMTPELAKTLSAAEQHEWYRKATSRRSMLRGGLVGAGAVIAGPALLAGGTASAATPTASPVGSASLLAKAPRPNGGLVVPFGRHLAYGSDPTRSMEITWQTPALVRRPFVRIGTSPWDLGERIYADLQNLSTPRTDITAVDSVAPSDTAAVQQYFLRAGVNNLRAGRTYYYVVGHDGWDSSGNLGAVRSFTTAPSDREPFTFTAFGDEGVTYDAVATTNLIRAQSPAFHLHAGDISYAEDGGEGLITDSYDPRVWDSFFNQIEPVASTVPWQVAVGNHEMETWYSPDGYGAQFDRFAFPTHKTTYYSFTYGNVAVLSLDANDVSNEIPANRGYTGGKQTAWLAKQLKAYRDRSDIDFIVAYFHHCAYCTSSAHSSEGGVRTNWIPLFDKYSVDLVVNGHNHLYERTDPLKNGAVTVAAPIGSTITPATQGTTYITAGGAGESLYQFTAADSYEGSVNNVSAISAYVNQPSGEVAETVDWSRVRYTGYCLVVVDSKPARRGGTSTLTVRGLSEKGVELDRFVLARRA